MAEGFGKQWLTEHGLSDQYRVESRSLSTDYEPVGSPPSMHGQELMRELYGIEISANRSQLLSTEDVTNAALLIGVSKSHENSVRRHFQGRANLSGLRSLNFDIPDPWHSDRATYEACARMIQMAVAEKLSEELSSPS